MILTIGREYGSGGHDIGEAISRQLGLKLYDKTALKEEAKKSDLYDEMKMFFDEEPIDSLLYAIAQNTAAKGLGRIPFAYIRDLAVREPCIIIGRCANYILRDHPDLVSVFIHADSDKRIAKIASDNQVSEEKAKKMIAKEDRRRETFYGHYTNESWKSSSAYHLSLDSGRLGTEGAVSLILEYIRIWEQGR